jgi:murein L,D-transpeptidase YcbB/YkuD
MRVIVGRAMRTQTPAFAGVLRTVVFSPYWNVPRSITRKEVLPKARRDPGYLAREEMEIVSGSRVLPDGASSLAQLDAGGAELRERPGPHNALGRVKFLFPNSHSVYLHDTPGKQAFERSRRDFSHGCIRVADAEALAQWVLRGREDWPPERIREAMEARRETSVRVDPPVPVVIYYTTAVAEIDGTIRFYEDIYGQDAALERALAAGYPRPS